MSDALKGLCNPASLDIFSTWYALGGSQSPPSLLELSQLPAWLLVDIRYIYSVIGEERDKAKEREKHKKAVKSSIEKHKRRSRR